MTLINQKKSVFAALALLFQVSIVICTNSAIGNTHNSHYEQAILSFLEADLKSAHIHLKNSIKQDTNHLPSRILNTKVFIGLGKGGEAEVEIGKAVKAGADDGITTPLLMESLLLQRKFDQVIEFVEEDLHVNENKLNKSLLLYRALAMLGKRRFHSADGGFREVLHHSPDDIKAMLGRAQVALKQGKFIKSIAFIDNALAIDPNHVNALLMNAVVHQMTGELENAILDVHHVLKLKPNNSPARLIYSVLLMEKGDMLSAKSELEKILAIIPNEPGANFLKYLTSISLGKTKESEKTLSHLINVLDAISDEIKQDFPIFYYLASLVDYQQQNYFKAERSITKYLKLNTADSKAQKLHAKIAIAQQEFHVAKSILTKIMLYKFDDVEALSLLGKVHMVLGESAKAEYFFNQVIQKQSNDILGVINLSKLQMLNQEFHRVVMNLKDHEALGSTPEALLLISKAYIEIGKPHLGLTHLERLLTFHPDDSYIHQIKAAALGLTGDIPASKQSYHRALELAPDNNQAIIHLARIDVMENKIDNAIAKLTAQDKEYGPNSALLVELGDVYQRSNNEKYALNMYSKALDRNPLSFLALTRLVAVYQRKEDLAKAINLTESFINKDSKNSEAYSLLGKLYYADKQNNMAITAFNNAVKHSKRKHISLLELASFQTKLGRLISAKKSLLKALSWNDGFLPAYYKLIAITIQQKDKEHALDLIHKIETLTDNVAKINQFRGDLYSVLNNVEKAKHFYQLSIEQKPSQQSVLGLYRIFRGKQNFDEIIQLLTVWLANNTDDLISAIALAETYQDKADHQIALSYYLELLDRFPDNPILLNNIAMVYLSSGEYKQAAEMADRAYKIIPNSVIVLDTKAWIETNRGNYEQALSLLRQADAFDFNNFEVKYHLAITLDKLDRRSEAFNYLQEAASNYVDFPDKEQVILLFNQWESEKSKD